MALQMDRVLELADAVVTLSNRMTDLWAEIHQGLEANSDINVNWTPATFTFTATNATNLLNATSHGQPNGRKCRVSSSGVLPAPLLPGTDYWVVTSTANTFQLAATLGGSPIDLTSDGTGTHTFQPIEEYINLEANGNLEGKKFSPQEVANAIGSLNQIRTLITNGSPSQGDHLGNLNKLARPLG